ncbi:MAG: dienelactone hydrolase family protein, partial [Opitutaceae bacterium]|nr:dienelactone hydrolase family protein [Opitutaceae bacterium]
SMKGILIKPDGDGPFPAILISHGRGGTAEAFGGSKAREFVKMGFVCIAPDYTHAGPAGGGGKQGGKKDAPGQKGETAGDEKKAPGASDENLRRAAKCLDILQSLPSVDTRRLAAYGNSMGAFVTVALAAKESKRLKAAAITAGGVSPQSSFYASEEQATQLRVPLCILHGGNDGTVKPETSVKLKELLDRNGVPNERHLFEGIGHNLHQEKADDVYALMKAWFTKHGVLKE